MVAYTPEAFPRHTTKEEQEDVFFSISPFQSESLVAGVLHHIWDIPGMIFLLIVQAFFFFFFFFFFKIYWRS